MAATTKAELQARLAKLERALAREKRKSAGLKATAAEAGAQQQATAEILDVIRRSTAHVQPVLDAVAERAVKLSDSAEAGVFFVEGELLKFTAGFETTKSFAIGETMPIDRGSVIGRSIIDRTPTHVVDLAAASPKDFPIGRAYQKRFGHRSILAVPLMHEGRAVGAIALWRYEVRAFSAQHIALIRTFADQAVIAIENVRLFNETREALERQTATAEILKVIAGSPSDVQPVFDTIVDSASALFRRRATLRLVDDGTLRRVAQSAPVRAEKALPERMALDGESLVGQVALEGRAIQVPDMRHPDAPVFARRNAHKWDFRSSAVAPLLRGGRAIGVIAMTSPEPGALTKTQMALLSTFADQAVIAIENVRLFNETREALERQTSTAEILKVISGSPTDVQPVFDAVAENALRLLGALSATVSLRVGDALQLAAFTSTNPSGDDALKKFFPVSLVENPDTILAQAAIRGTPIPVSDTESAHGSPTLREMGRQRGWRSFLAVPMLNTGASIGIISVTRREAGTFSDHDIELLTTFADQAVIAIENVRLFNETKEALERQTATANILKVISGSPTDVAPVFNAILINAIRLCGGDVAAFWRYDGEFLRFAAGSNMTPEAEALAHQHPLGLGAYNPTPQAGLERRTVHVLDVFAEPTYRPLIPIGTTTRRPSAGTVIAVPLLRDDELLGVITIWRYEKRLFGEMQVEMLRTFADQAVIAIENVRLFNETKEALERQTATAEILRVISSSPSDLRPIFDAVARNAVNLCEGLFANVFQFDGELIHWVSSEQYAASAIEILRTTYPRRPDQSQVAGRVILSGASERLEDAFTDPDYDSRFAKSGGWRRMLGVPMIREGRAIGAIIVGWAEPGPISAQHEGLLRSFADQAVIAIENVRLFGELEARNREVTEALEQQTATAEILSAISSSPTDTRPVLEAIAATAQRLFNVVEVGIALLRNDKIELAAAVGENAEVVDALRDSFPRPLGLDSIVNRVVEHGVFEHVPDVSAADVPEHTRQATTRTGVRALLTVPLLREGTPIGGIFVARKEPVAFSDTHIALMRSFADQAVIAIENVRLFNETKEALERQTATAEILRVISESPTDVQPVFDAIARSGLKLFPGALVSVALRYGDTINGAAVATPDPARAEAWRNTISRTPLARNYMHGAALLDRRMVDIPDVADAPAEFVAGGQNFLTSGNRAITIMPMMRGDEAIGLLSVVRLVPGPLSDKQIAILRTFAAQAVIAIENVRLFNETKEALERQTATAEILKVISESPTDAQPVFEAIAESAARLFGTWNAGVLVREGEMIHVRAVRGLVPENVEKVEKMFPMPFNPSSILSARAIENGQFLEVPDTESPDVPSRARVLARAGGWRAVAFMPLLREGGGIGAIAMINRDPGTRFTEHQVSMLRTFADQAVIAIENVRLFKELEQRTEALTKSVGQLTALGEVGQTLSSTLDLDKVLPTIVSRAVQLTGLDGGAIYEYDEVREVFSMRAGENVRQEILELDRSEPIRIGDGAIGRAAATRQPVQVPDIAAASGRQTRGRDVLLQVGARALLAVPLLREDHILGALAVIRNTPGEFPPEVVELMQTFATQSAIAIQNARLFREIEDKSRQLEEASEHKSQFLASMSHELRTPLNAILGLNEMMLGEIYGEVPDDMRPPLAQTQASGRHLLSLINNVLDLAKIEANRMELALAAFVVQDLVASVRATLEPLAKEKGLEFVASAPDDLPLAYGDAGRLTQCLINLAGNALKFTKQGRVAIAVESRADTLRFSVADTGIGIPADKIESLFTEFKQTDATIASEYGGTGLGLAITKKFVEMHGGRIWVESEPGKGSVFIFEIPLRADTT